MLSQSPPVGTYHPKDAITRLSITKDFSITDPIAVPRFDVYTFKKQMGNSPNKGSYDVIDPREISFLDKTKHHNVC